jgi:glyceraldehyde-3-phosphate dehydrogenase/erythrose-4-phosphate dehydrogenase
MKTRLAPGRGRPPGCDRDVVEEAEAHRARRLGVVPRRAQRGDPAGAREVIVSAPAKEPDVTVVLASIPTSTTRSATTVDGTQAKIVAWYDNEWGYSSRLVDLAQKLLVPVLEAA